MMVLLKADRLRKCFGTLAAVDGISLTVRKGEVLGFLGPNGAGKSTTMKILTGFIEPDEGRVRIAGLDMAQQPREAKRIIGYLPEGAPLYGDMTPRQFLAFIAAIRGCTAAQAKDSIDQAAERTGLDGVMDQTIETLSKGYKRRVGLAQAILHDPEVLILDEPTDGLDPNQKHQVRNLIAGMAKDKAIVVSTHILEEVEAVCSRAIIIDKGRIVADGTAVELQRRAPNHNAVAMRVDQAVVERVREALGCLDGVARVETVAQENGQVRLRAVPKGDVLIAADVASALADRSLAVAEMVVERGRLDDVFRQITSPDTGGHRA